MKRLAFCFALFAVFGMFSFASSPVANASSPGWDWDVSLSVQSPAGVVVYHVVNIPDADDVTVTTAGSQHALSYTWPGYGNGAMVWNSSTSSYRGNGGDQLEFAFVDGGWRFRGWCCGHYTIGAEVLDF